MKRDMELIRLLLLINEAGSDEGFPEYKKFTEEQVGYHVYLLGSAGLAETQDCSHSGSSCTQHYMNDLTWAGHEFLESVRSPERWTTVKGFLEKSRNFSYELIKLVVAQIAKDAVT